MKKPHKIDCTCAFHAGRRNHRPDCCCQWHRREPTNNGGGPKPRPLAEILIENGQRGKAQRVKLRLVSEGIKIDICEICGLRPEWNSKSLVLQLDHRNGKCTDWRLENLQILCPNCHSQTSTFAGRNQGGKIRRVLR